MREVSLKIFFILGKGLLKRNLTISLTSTIKINFTLSYPNKNHSLKLTFDIFKSNKNYSFKSNYFKKPSFKSQTKHIRSRYLFQKMAGKLKLFSINKVQENEGNKVAIGSILLAWLVFRLLKCYFDIIYI